MTLFYNITSESANRTRFLLVPRQNDKLFISSEYLWSNILAKFHPKILASHPAPRTTSALYKNFFTQPLENQKIVATFAVLKIRIKL